MMSKKRPAVENPIVELSILEQIAELIARSKTSESVTNYLQLLTDVQSLCKSEIEKHDLESDALKVEGNLLDIFVSNVELIKLIKQVEIIRNKYEYFDYLLATDKQLAFGDLLFSRTYNGDREGEGSITADISFRGQCFTLIEADEDKDILSTRDLNYEDYPEILTIYKKMKFGKKVSKDLFLEFVIAVYGNMSAF